MATRPWSPLRAALLAFTFVLVIGIVLTVAFTVSTGAVHDSPFARGQQAGTGIGVVAVLAGGVAYGLRSRRR